MKNICAKLSIGQIILWLLAGFGIVLILYRYLMGLGSVTNLSDGYPWGIWKGINVVAIIPMAAGGFVMAGLIHLFGGRKYHSLARMSILTAFLGYLLFIFGLVVDIGRPWNFWAVIVSWNHSSPMFEVAWCVMLYTGVLFMEFLPAVFKRFHLDKFQTYWESLVPWLVIGMLGFFTLAMSYSFTWTLIMVLILLVWEIFMRTGVMPRDKQMPILLIMAGVMFSIMHQSGLGSLFLIIPLKLHPLWYSPIMPLLFLLSAIMVAPAMVTLVAMLNEMTTEYKAPFNLIKNLAKSMPYLLGFYLLLKIADLIGSGDVTYVFMLNPQAVSWWLEITLGVIIPLVLYITPEVRDTKGGLLWSSILVIVGLIWNQTQSYLL